MAEIEIDRAALLAEVYRRNALRRAAQLPPLDVQAEYEHACAVAAWKEYRRRAEAFAEDKKRIRAEVQADLRVRFNDPRFGGCMGSRLLVGKITEERFRDFVHARLGIVRPPIPTKNPIIYGGERRERE